MTTSTLTPPTNNDTLAEALRADLALITRVTHPYQSGPAAVARNHPALRDAARRWLPEAHRLRETARTTAPSPAEAAHWTTVIDATTHALTANGPDTSFEALHVTAMSVKELLVAIATAHRSPHTVHDLVHHLAADITDGTLPPNTPLALTHITTRYNVSFHRARMVRDDLITAGLARHHSNQVLTCSAPATPRAR
jgi:hypothetical protein